MRPAKLLRALISQQLGDGKQCIQDRLLKGQVLHLEGVARLYVRPAINIASELCPVKGRNAGRHWRGGCLPSAPRHPCVEVNDRVADMFAELVVSWAVAEGPVALQSMRLQGEITGGRFGIDEADRAGLLHELFALKDV